jgi:hypothetical protein
MFSINKCIVFLALSLTTATALSHGNLVQRNNHHEVARGLVDDLTKRDITVSEAAIKRRGSNSKRCKPRPSSSSSSNTSTSSTSSSAQHKATPAKAVFSPPPTSSASSTWSKHVHTPTSSPAPKASPKASTSGGGGGGGGGQSFSGGSATYYLQNGQAGACGQTNPDTALVCALFTSVYNNGANCGKTVRVTNVSNGKTVDVTAADECPTCDGPNYVDFSKGAFDALGGTEEEGMFPITYTIM